MLTQLECFQLINTRFPHIGKRMMGMAEPQEVVVFIEELLATSSSRFSKGFPDDIKAALASLLEQQRKQLGVPAEEAKAAAHPEVLAGSKNFQAVLAYSESLGQNLAERWGSEEFSTLINELLQGRGMAAGGELPMEVAGALIRLMMEHDRHAEGAAQEKSDIWAYRTVV